MHTPTNVLTYSSSYIVSGSGNIDALRYFLDSLNNAEDVNITDDANYTPLHDAAEEGVPQAVQLLLKHGARADIKNKVWIELGLVSRSFWVRSYY